MKSDLWAFTRFGPENAKTCPVNARVSISPTLLNLPGRAGSSSSDSTLAVWAAAERLAWRHSTCPGRTCSSNLAVWAVARQQQGRCCSSLQSKFKLNLLQKFNVKFTGKLIPIISSFNLLSQTLKLKFKKCWRYKYETQQQHVNWQPGARQQHVPVIWSQTELDWLQAWLGVLVQVWLYFIGAAVRRQSSVPCAVHRLGPADSEAGTPQQSTQVFSCYAVTRMFCYVVSIHFRKQMNLSLEVYQSRSLVLIATSDRSLISDNGNVKLLNIHC